MIKTEIIAPDTLKIVAPEKLTADDFRQIAPQFDSLVSQHGKIKLLIDASGFNGSPNTPGACIAAKRSADTITRCSRLYLGSRALSAKLSAT